MPDAQTIPTVNDLTTAELETIREALDSHLYWQINEDHSRRNSGHIMEPLTDAERAVEALQDKVQSIINGLDSDRSPERVEFLSDILIAAIEGGTGYWAQVSQYQYLDDGELKVFAAPRKPDEGTRATIHVLKDDESGYEEQGHDITVDTIAKGIGRIVRGEVKIKQRMRDAIAEASAGNEADNIDADDADAIVQAALFGELVYS